MQMNWTGLNFPLQLTVWTCLPASVPMATSLGPPNRKYNSWLGWIIWMAVTDANFFFPSIHSIFHMPTRQGRVMVKYTYNRPINRHRIPPS